MNQIKNSHSMFLAMAVALTQFLASSCKTSNGAGKFYGATRVVDFSPTHLKDTMWEHCGKQLVMKAGDGSAREFPIFAVLVWHWVDVSDKEATMEVRPKAFSTDSTCVSRTAKFEEIAVPDWARAEDKANWQKIAPELMKAREILNFNVLSRSQDNKKMTTTFKASAANGDRGEFTMLDAPLRMQVVQTTANGTNTMVFAPGG